MPIDIDEKNLKHGVLGLVVALMDLDEAKGAWNWKLTICFRFFISHRAHRGTEKIMELNYISSQVIAAAINVHKELGPRLLESGISNMYSHRTEWYGDKDQVRGSPPNLLSRAASSWSRVSAWPIGWRHGYCGTKVSWKGSECTQKATSDISTISQKASWIIDKFQWDSVERWNYSDYQYSS